jgi:DUF1365 family protein
VNSCIYEGIVRHRRFGPIPHDFTIPLYMMYLDLAELSTVFEGRWFWSSQGPAPAWFRAADYLGQGKDDLSEAVRSEALRLTGRRPTGPIRMLTHLRYMGVVMNPVTFYYCFRPGGEELDVILAEITNTPWKERHRYALTAVRRDSVHADHTYRFDKTFHISPFMPMSQQYAWRFNEPGGALRVHMENHEGTTKVFDASLNLRRSEITGPSLAQALVRFPLMTARVAVGIYWQALKLRLKGVPYHAHPNKLAA